MPQPVAAALLAVLVVLVWGLMYLGWQRRGRRDQALPAPLAPAEDAYAGALAVFPGVYVSTTRHGDWLDRVVAHGLGTRSAVDVVIHPDDVCLVREGARSLLVPRGDLVAVGRATGMAGKFVERDGLVVLTWRLPHAADHVGGDPASEVVLDTGVRLRRAQDVAPLTAALEQLVEGKR